MKVVKNSCYGGFGLSHKALMEYATRKGITLYPEIDNIDKKRTNDFNKAVLVHYHTVPNEEYQKIKEEADKTRDWSKSNELYFSSRNIDRSDPVLIEVIEELGSEVASGRHSELEIVEVPDDVEWHIAEYDGNEWVAEDHRTW